MNTCSGGGRKTKGNSGRNPQAREVRAGRSVSAIAQVDPFYAQHAQLRTHQAVGPAGCTTVLVNETESPLAWLARRRGKDGRPLIAGHQLLAGEHLRADFTRAQLTPRITANWTASVASGRRADGGGTSDFSDAVIAAKQRVRHALDAVGPEFSGLLLDVCCFLKGLDRVESERRWPARSAKVVLQLALDRLARHYGIEEAARGRSRRDIRTWLAEDATFVVESV
jgi:hypothetical protein